MVSNTHENYVNKRFFQFSAYVITRHTHVFIQFPANVYKQLKFVLTGSLRSCHYVFTITR